VLHPHDLKGPEGSAQAQGRRNFFHRASRRHSLMHAHLGLGTPEFIAAIEKATQRHLAPQKGGRLEKPPTDGKQRALTFD